MRRRGARSSLWLTVVATTLAVLWSTVVIACSGPGAAATIRQSQHIAWSLAGLSIVIIVASTSPLVFQGKVGAIIVLWCLAAIHPGIWMSVNHGDCGYTARACSLFMTVVNALAVTLALKWPRSVNGEVNKRRGAIRGGLAGAIASIVLVFLQLSASRPSAGETDTLLVAGWSFMSSIIAGAVVGALLCSPRERPWFRPRFRLRTVMLLLAVMAPFLIIVLPVRRYDESVSATGSFYFLVVDQETRRPIANATVRLIDPRYKPEEQQKVLVTQTDGHAEVYLFANVTGREGLLFRTETFTYDPVVLEIEAPNYEPFRAPLSDDTPARSGAYTHRPLDLAFPPPPWAVVGFWKSASSDGPPGKPWVQEPERPR
jgi:hypothetical protein